MLEILKTINFNVNDVISADLISETLKIMDFNVNDVISADLISMTLIP